MDDASLLYRPGPEDARTRTLDGLLYGTAPGRRDLWTRDRADAAFTDELRSRVRADRDAVVLVWGDAGCGKSTFVLDRMRKVDDTFSPANLAERIAFHAEEVPRLYDRTPQYGAACIDEAAAAGLLSSEPPSSLRQRSLIELVSIIRAKNVVLFVVIPDPDNLAKTFRVRRADYRVECGFLAGPDSPRVAHVGHKVARRHFFTADQRWLGFSDDRIPLTWPEYRGSRDPVARALWDAYWPLKRAFMADETATIARRLDRLRRRDDETDEE